MRKFVLAFAAICLASVAIVYASEPREDQSTPNVIVIFTDDQGYGDLGVYGHPTIKTPNLDRMANEGQRWTSFYVAANVCTPSRAGLLTGRLPIRTGMSSDKPRVLFPDSEGGLPQSELTMAEMFKSVGYSTAAIGKWHLGHLPQYLPTNQGFDSYYGRNHCRRHYCYSYGHYVRERPGDLNLAHSCWVPVLMMTKYTKQENFL